MKVYQVKGSEDGTFLIAGSMRRAFDEAVNYVVCSEEGREAYMHCFEKKKMIKADYKLFRKQMKENWCSGVSGCMSDGEEELELWVDSIDCDVHMFELA